MVVWNARRLMDAHFNDVVPMPSIPSKVEN